MSTSLIIGAGGQDGTFLTERLARRGDNVVCVGRHRVWSAPAADWEPTDIAQAAQVMALVQRAQPDECYYLPAFHHSAEDASLSSGAPALFERSYEVHVRGLLHFLNAIAQTSRQTRLFYAASSHVFGPPPTELLDESTPLNPENIYGITKTSGIHCCRHFRREMGLFAATGILFNHESHLRPAKFLSQKIVQGVLAFKKDPARKLVLGDPNAAVDWGFAGDYAEAMTCILKYAVPEDFVVATGEAHTVGEFLRITCEIVGVDWRDCAVTDARLLTKKPVRLVGDSGKLRRLTGWHPQTSFRAMIEKMVAHARGQTR